MTRIFDALKKTQSAREPVPMTPPAMLHSVRPAPRPVERLEIVPIAGVAPVDANVKREMAALRVHLEGSLGARNPRSIMLVAPRAGDGTSTVALQFAQSLARDAGHRVLLVDANPLRGSPLLDSARAASEESHENGTLHLLPLGERLRRTGSMSTAAIRDLLEASGAGYDWMILDGPPLLESPEAAPLAAQFEGVLVVVRAGRTKRPVLVRAVDLLRRSQANVLGTVLNRRRLEIPSFLYRRI